MNRLNEFWKQLTTKQQPLPPGMYSYQAPADAAVPYRLHLRLEPDGQGILIVNASTVLHLNQTAAEFAYYLITEKSDEEAIAEIARRYHVSKQQAAQDYMDMKERLRSLVSEEDLDPVTYLGFDRLTPYATNLSAPLRLDCAITYQTSDGNPLDAPLSRVRRELLSTEWMQILDHAWEGGIPHVIFTGGEPTLRADLPELIAHAEKLGMVAGLLTDGLRLTDYQYLHSLLDSGLDHLMIMLDPENSQSWEAIRDALNENIFTTVHLTGTAENLPAASEVLDRLAAMGLKSLSLSTNTLALKERLQDVRQAAAERGLSLVWDLPVPYSSFHPVALELSEHEEPPSGAGKAWLYVEPDGDVLPVQGSSMVMGNLLTDPWEKIWKQG